MDKTRIIQQGEVAKFQVQIKDFDMESNDFRVELIFGYRRHKVTIEKTQMLENGGTYYFTIDTANNRLLSAYNKAKKVGGMYLALKGVAVKPTDAVDAKKTYTLLLMDGTEPQPEPDDDGGEVTPVTPE